MLAVQADGAELMTVEGLATAGRLHPLQEAFREHHALQCGFCTPGMLLTALDLLRTNPRPTEEEIRHGLSAVLCRCTGYQGIVAAVAAAAPALDRPRLPARLSPSLIVGLDRWPGRCRAGSADEDGGQVP